MTPAIRNYARALATTESLKLSENFNLAEFTCGMSNPCKHCGAVAFISPQLVDMLEDIRAIVGKPIRILSGYRCLDHNREIGGATSSMHMVGFAADIAPPTGMSISRFYELCQLGVKKYQGGCGCYIKSNFVHVDVRCLPPNRRWTQ